MDVMVRTSRATTVRYSLCRLNAGLGGEDPDEPPDCLYGLQVRGPPFSLGGSLLWGTAGCFSLGGGSDLLFVGFSVLVMLCPLSMSRAALSTRHMGALSFRRSCL